jgi:DNA polymerase-1
VLIVADYGQLELRLLAHITKCKSMLTAFREGGDFHSRTAMGMYPEVEEAIAKGEVLLEVRSPAFVRLLARWGSPLRIYTR